MRGGLSFVYFSLATQRKVHRRQGETSTTNTLLCAIRVTIEKQSFRLRRHHFSLTSKKKCYGSTLIRSRPLDKFSTTTFAPIGWRLVLVSKMNFSPSSI